MRSMLLGGAAAVVIAITATPAQAQNGGMSQSHGVTIHRGFDSWGGGGGDNRHHRRDRGDIRFGGPPQPRADATIVDWDMGYGGQWALYNNQTFEPDSYNDWWHERPWRAYPRWMNSSSCNRLWWGGGEWRCSW